MSMNVDDFVIGDGVIEPPVKETPLPNENGGQPPVRRKPVRQRPQVQTPTPQDPNIQVEKPEVPKRDYNAAAKAPKRQQQTAPVQPQMDIQVQNMQAMPTEEHAQMHQAKRQPQQRQRVAPAQAPQQQVNPQAVGDNIAVAPQQPPKKKKSILPIIAVIAVIAVIGVVAVKFMNKEPVEPPLVAQTYDYNTSGRYAVDQFQIALNTFDATKIDAIVGTEDGDSYIAQEWAYVNRDLRREDFIKKVTGVVKFTFPQVQQISTTGVAMYDDIGNPIMVDSMLNNGETIQVTIPDYHKMAVTMDEDKVYIQKLFKSSGYSEDDYEWYNNMANLMLQYICEKPSIPTTTVDIVIPVGLNVSGQPYIKEDTELDKLLFSSDDFHTMCAKFSQICLDWTGNKEEFYVVQEEQKNPEYDEWYNIFLEYYNADNGKFNKKTSKWEPWYLRDENNQYILDENGEKIVNYYSVKAEDGTDCIQPAEYILVDVVKSRQVPDPWVEETGILYNWIGQYYIKYEYQGIGDTIIRVGDGSKDRPAGIGTSIITKVKDVNGVYRDIRVSMIGYWTGEDAINYAEKFSSKNRGFTTTSVIQLITFELEIENLDDEPITITSELTLCDANSNPSSRTGTMYGFTEEFTVGAGKSIIINDWATSTELSQKYACWGKSFGRTYSMVYFDVLAGTGDIPSYSAYKAFTGESSMNK